MKRWWIISLIVIFVIVALFVLGQKRNRMHSIPAGFETVKVVRGDIEVKVLATGTIQSYTRVEVRAPQRGRIDQVEVDEGDFVKKGEVLAWISSEDRIALLDAAQASLAEARRENRIEAIREAERAYEIANRAYKMVPITTSISGRVIKRACEPGQNVSLDNILFVLSDRLVANVEVDEADIGKIRIGQKAWITLDAFPDQRIEGRVTKISLEGRVVNDVVVYDVMVDAITVPKYWSSGMTANLEFVAESKKDILIVPATAVRRRNGETFVLVLKDKPIIRPVKTGITDRKMTEICEGLSPGEEVVIGELKGREGRPNAINRSMRLLRRPR